MKKIKLYNAGGLFSELEVTFRKFQGRKLRECFGDRLEIYNPIDAPFNEDKDASVPSPVDIWKGDRDQLFSSDILLFDFSELNDPGVCAEIGYFTKKIDEAKEKGDRLPIIIGVISDIRRSTANSYPTLELPPLGTNHMVLGILMSYNNKIVHSFDEAIQEIEKYLSEI